MIFGYARVSTDDQNLDSQVAELESLQCNKIFIEKQSAKNLERKELKALLEQLRPKDVLIVTRIDRLARSLKDLVFLLDDFSSRGIVLQLGTLRLDFSTPEGKLYAHLFGAVAEFERQIIRNRTMAGLKSARAKGKVGGKPKGLSEEAKKTAKKVYEHRLKGLTANELLKLSGIKSKRTLYKYIRYEAERLSKLTDKEISKDGLCVL